MTFHEFTVFEQSNGGHFQKACSPATASSGGSSCCTYFVFHDLLRTHQILQRPRDPRFSDLSGNLSVDHFRSHYNFLPDLHTGELSTLKQTLARARKLLISSPAHLREEREEEVNRLELAVKRAESTVNRERREEAERQALGKLSQEEREKRKSGKRGWWLKDGASPLL
jgi:hypothetical protein